MDRLLIWWWAKLFWTSWNIVIDKNLYMIKKNIFHVRDVKECLQCSCHAYVNSRCTALETRGKKRRKKPNAVRILSAQIYCGARKVTSTPTLHWIPTRIPIRLCFIAQKYISIFARCYLSFFFLVFSVSELYFHIAISLKKMREKDWWRKKHINFVFIMWKTVELNRDLKICVTYVMKPLDIQAMSQKMLTKFRIQIVSRRLSANVHTTQDVQFEEESSG